MRSFSQGTQELRMNETRRIARRSAWCRRRGPLLMALLCLMSLSPVGNVTAQPPPGGLIVYLQQQLGLSEVQVRGALGALLVFANQRLFPSDFDDLAKRIPNAN